MAVYHILGVMSGSSLDGLDMAIVQFHVRDSEITEWHCLKTSDLPLPAEWRSKLTHLVQSDIMDFYQTDAAFGKFIGMACNRFIEDCGIRPDVIASHGHTILHRPEEGFSVQIGNPAQIARLTGCHVVTDFRSSDIAAGGQGAPLAPVVEKYLFPGFDYYLNLGGIANLSYFPKGHGPVAWDIAPCNQLLNYLAAQMGLPYDDRGAIAHTGKVDQTLLDALKQPLQLPLRRPLSLDNSWVQQHYLPILDASAGSTADNLATVAEYSAQCVRIQMQDLHEVNAAIRLFVTGGGAHNDDLLARIRQQIAPAELFIPSREIIDYKESILMALCGLHRMLRLPNALGSVTGAEYDTINGQLTVAHKRDQTPQRS